MPFEEEKWLYICISYINRREMGQWLVQGKDCNEQQASGTIGPTEVSGR